MSFETQTQNMNEQQQTTTTQKKSRIVVPPMCYDLKQATGQTVLTHLIDLKINHGEFAEHVSKYMQRLKTNPNQRVNFGYIPAPPHSEVTQRVIGMNGHFFKMTTTLSGVDLIWHDHFSNQFFFWGPSVFKVVKAMNSIRWRIHKCYTTMPPPLPPKRVKYQHVEEVSDDEDDNGSSSSMPDLVDYDGNVISVGSVPDHENGSID